MEEVTPPIVEEVKPDVYAFGILANDYTLEEKTIKPGESWSTILARYGIGITKVLRLEALAKDICPLSGIKAGNKYTAFICQDSIDTHIDYLVYEKNNIDYVIFTFKGDSISVSEGKRDVKIIRKKNTCF